MRKLYENFHIFYFQKRIVSAETIRGNKVNIDYGPFRQISVDSTLDFYSRPGRKETNVPLHKRI